MDGGCDTLAPQWLQFEKELGFRPLLHGPDFSAILEGDARIGAAMVSKFTFPPSDTTVLSTDYALPDGVALRVYRPARCSDLKPLGVYIHGGGWAMGSIDLDDGFCRRIVSESAVMLVSVDYRLAPAHPYPAGLDDCVDAFKWALEHAEELEAQSRKVFVIGASAGAGLALGVALKAIDEGLGAHVKGVVAQQPVTCHPDAVPDAMKHRYTSYERNAELTINTADVMKTFFELHAAPKDDPYISCLLHPRLHDLPPVYINACEADTLLDDARLFKSLLEKNG